LTDLPEPFHVCFLTGEYPPMRGGVGDYTALLSAALAARGVTSSIVTSTGARGALLRDRAPLAPAVYPAITDWEWSSWPRLRRLLADLRPDVVHLQYQTGAFRMAPAVNVAPLWLRGAGRRRPFVSTYHDLKAPYLFPRAGPLRELANRLLRRLSDAAIVTNHEDMVRVGAGWADLVPIGSNVAKVCLSRAERRSVRERLGLADKELAVGYFGFVDPWKGVETIVSAFGRLIASGRSARLVFVGGVRAGGPSEYERVVTAQIADAALERMVVRTGYGSAEETSAYLQALDCIALPFADGACYRHGTLAAAIVHSLPILTTRSVPTPELGLPRLVDGESALLVPPGDERALADGLMALADDAALRVRLAAGAYALAPRFAWDSIAGRHVALYERLLVGRARPGGAWLGGGDEAVGGGRG